MNCTAYEIQCSSLFLLRGSFCANAHSLQHFMYHTYYHTTVKKPDDDHNDDTLYIMCICSIFHGLWLFCTHSTCAPLDKLLSFSFPDIGSSLYSIIIPKGLAMLAKPTKWDQYKKWNCSRRRFWKTNTIPYYRKRGWSIYYSLF